MQRALAVERHFDAVSAVVDWRFLTKWAAYL